MIDFVPIQFYTPLFYYFNLVLVIFIFIKNYTKNKLQAPKLTGILVLFIVIFYIGFVVFISSFSFWAYGINGIRNGLAASIVLYAFTFENKRVWGITIALSGILFHKAMLLPVMAYLLTFFYNNRVAYLRLWLLSIPISLAAGGSFEVFFASLGFEDERVGYLVDGNVNNDVFASTGFRWDFLLYSASAVFIAWYFIVKKNFKDQLYHRIFNVYLISNAFWILVIRANFSNRFAYLSWFMMGLVVIYPFLKQQMIPNQARKTAVVVFVYFMFTFLLNVLLI